MSPRLADRTALVTGATSNLGRAIAIAYAREGAHVVVQGRDEARAAEVVRTIRESGGRADAVLVDLDGSEEAVQQLVSRATALLGGRVDVLVNNAGIFPASDTAGTDAATFDRIFAVNVKTPFLLTGALAPRMAERGDGVVVNLGSWITRLAVPIATAYASSKGALETLTRAWAAEYGPKGVRVNAISPGVVHGNADDHPGEVFMRGTPANRIGSPEDVAAAAVYLASRDARFVHGATLDVDGGRNAVAVVSA